MNAQSRIKARLAAANAMENPLSGLESFLSIKVDTASLSIKFKPSPLPDMLRKQCRRVIFIESHLGHCQMDNIYGRSLVTITAVSYTHLTLPTTVLV